jgi:hypothetical protein
MADVSWVKLHHWYKTKAPISGVVKSIYGQSNDTSNYLYIYPLKFFKDFKNEIAVDCFEVSYHYLESSQAKPTNHTMSRQKYIPKKEMFEESDPPQIDNKEDTIKDIFLSTKVWIQRT